MLRSKSPFERGMTADEVWQDRNNDECEEGGGRLGSNLGICTHDEEAERRKRDSLIEEYLERGSEKPCFVPGPYNRRTNAVLGSISAEWKRKVVDEWSATHSSECRSWLFSLEDVDDLLRSEKLIHGQTTRDFFKENVWIGTFMEGVKPWLIVDQDKLDALRDYSQFSVEDIEFCESVIEGWSDGTLSDADDFLEAVREEVLARYRRDGVFPFEEDDELE